MSGIVGWGAVALDAGRGGLYAESACAGMVKWYHESLPSSRCGFDSRYPLQAHLITDLPDK